MLAGPPANAVDVWLVESDRADDSTLARLAELMSKVERERHDALRFAKDRRLFVIARAMVRVLLSRYTGEPPAAWTFGDNRWGRPEIESPAVSPLLRFNLSHTKGMVACIIARDREIGIDVEDVTRPTRIQVIADSVFSPTEVRDLRQLPAAEQTRRFFELWTLKEAYIKARGMGLALPLDQFSYRFTPEPVLTIDAELGDDGASWQLGLWRPTGRHQAALAIRRREADLIVNERRLDIADLPWAE